jgi:hypothetical protein
MLCDLSRMILGRHIRFVPEADINSLAELRCGVLLYSKVKVHKLRIYQHYLVVSSAVR